MKDIIKIGVGIVVFKENKILLGHRVFMNLIVGVYLVVNKNTMKQYLNAQ